MMVKILMAALLFAANAAGAADPTPDELARAYGARPSIISIALSPDGSSLAYVAAGTGPTSGLYTIDLAKDSEPKLAMYSDGKPERLEQCIWVSNQRLACRIGQVVDNGRYLLPISRWVALDRDGSAVKLLSNPSSKYTRAFETWGGDIVDWLPDQDGAVLMTRRYYPDATTGSHIGSTASGIGLDWIDTRTGQSKQVESPGDSVWDYITDNHGVVRIMMLEESKKAADGETGLLDYRYRKAGSKDWLKLAEYDRRTSDGFEALRVDPDANLVYGKKQLDGRSAVYTKSMDDSLTEKLVASRPDANIDGLITIGRGTHAIGGYYKTDILRSIYFDPAMQRVADMIARSMPRTPAVNIVDSNAAENKLVVFASAADDPGRYYLFDRATRQLRPLVSARNPLDGYKFAATKSITYPASDGKSISAYLTVPAENDHPHGLPAIVLLHDNGDTEDKWGAGWLVQFFAARGFVVLQANVRGTEGYRGWRKSTGDTVDAGRWLVSQGLADPARLFVFGWSFGGYVALQSATVEPGLFKGVIAVGPIADLTMLKDQSRGWSNHGLMEDAIGSGGEVTEGSPSHNAARMKAPVLLFHGTLDLVSSIKQSERMDAALKDAKVDHELIRFDQLGDDIDDSDARAQLLAKSDAFFRRIATITKP